MIKPRHTLNSLPDAPQELTAGGRMRRRILRSTALLPAMFTVGNGLCGFASIYFATKVNLGSTDLLAVKGVGHFPLLAVAGWLIVAAMVCDMLDGRLARFNVESTPDESAHMSFSGLPSPGAAANIAALVLLFEHAYSIAYLRATWLFMSVSIVLPLVTMIVALLMVSRIRYPHLVNQYIRGKKPFNYLVKLVVVVVAMWLEPFAAVAALTLGYTLWGPLRAAWRHFRPMSVAEGTKGPGIRE